MFRLDGVVEGWIPVQEGRISDGLNRSDHMRVAVEVDGGSGGSREFRLDEVVAVAPAPRPPSAARVARRRHRVELEAGPYLVSGVAYLPVGADPQRYVASIGRRWLPLTDCRVSVADDEFAVEVVIVNLDYATRRTVANVAPLFG